jgi:putative glutathione S-transferase
VGNESNVAVSENVHEITGTGGFARQKNRFTTPFGSGSGELPVEAGRYRLIVSTGCPWAHRQLITLKALGLEKTISIGRTGPRTKENGWVFSLDEGSRDPVLGVKYLKEAYEKTDPSYSGRATVPAVIDVKTGKVVNNDYHKLSNYWETVWKPFHKEGAPDLYPEDLRGEIDALNEILFNDVNNGVYKAGFAQTQAEYEKAYDALFARLDSLEDRLSKTRYLFGDKITDSDVRLYVTLARFDCGYYMAFKTNRNRLCDFTHLWNYAKDLYQTPCFGETTDFETIKRTYQLISNPVGLISAGPDLSVWNGRHGRGEGYGL